MVITTLASLFIYAPLAWRETELSWNPDTGNFDLHGYYPTWSLCIAMLSAFAIILPTNIAILLKISREQRFRRAFSSSGKSTISKTLSSGDSTIPELTDEYNQSGCMPRVQMPKFDMKMTFVLIGISFAFIVLTIPHRCVNIYYDLLIFANNPFMCRFLVVNASIRGITISELAVAITNQVCKVNFACNSLFYFFLASECRLELKKTCCC